MRIISSISSSSTCASSRTSSFTKTAKRSLSGFVVVVGILASVASLPVIVENLIFVLTDVRALPTFPLDANERVSHLIVVQVSEPVFSEAPVVGELATTINVSIPCSRVDGGGCAEFPSDVSVVLTFVEIDDEGVVVGEPQFSSLIADQTSVPMWVRDRATTRGNRRATFAFEARRSDDVDVQVSISTRVEALFYFPDSTASAEGGSLVIGFDDVPADFVFPSGPGWSDAGVDDDAGGPDAG